MLPRSSRKYSSLIFWITRVPAGHQLVIQHDVVGFVPAQADPAHQRNPPALEDDVGGAGAAHAGQALAHVAVVENGLVRVVPARRFQRLPPVLSRVYPHAPSLATAMGAGGAGSRFDTRSSDPVDSSTGSCHALGRQDPPHPGSAAPALQDRPDQQGDQPGDRHPPLHLLPHPGRPAEVRLRAPEQEGRPLLPGVSPTCGWRRPWSRAWTCRPSACPTWKSCTAGPRKPPSSPCSTGSTASPWRPAARWTPASPWAWARSCPCTPPPRARRCWPSCLGRMRSGSCRA